jgi:hypothetical protein
VQELVIIIADVYLPPAAAAAPEPGVELAHLPGIESAGRFGARAALEDWRAWLARRLGRPDLAGVAYARVAAAAATADAGAAGDTLWLATPVHLSAGLTRVHLNQRGLLRLRGEEQSVLAGEFRRTFGGEGLVLLPLGSGEFLLRTPGLAAHPAGEPARSAGSAISAPLPHSAAATPLRRLLAEIEMWLHGLPLNEARRRAGELPVTALWLWGAVGADLPPVGALAVAFAAFGTDAWLAGLAQLCGRTLAAPPADFGAVLHTDALIGVVVAEVRGVLERQVSMGVAEALSVVDSGIVLPALAALRSGAVARTTLVLNDRCATMTRGSRLRLWRRRRAGLAGFA